MSAGGEQAPEDLAEQLLQGLEPHGLSMARVREVLVANLQVGRKACVADGWGVVHPPTLVVLVLIASAVLPVDRSGRAGGS